MKGEQKLIVFLVFLLCTIIASGSTYFVVSQQEIQENKEKITTLEKELEAIKKGQQPQATNTKKATETTETEKKETTNKGNKDSQTVKKVIHRTVSVDVQKEMKSAIDMSGTQGSTNEYVTRGQFVKLLSVLLKKSPNTSKFNSTVAPPETYVYHSESNQPSYLELQNINYYMKQYGKEKNPLNDVFGEEYRSDNFVTYDEVKYFISNFGVSEFEGLNSYTSKSYVDKNNLITFLSSISNEVKTK